VEIFNNRLITCPANLMGKRKDKKEAFNGEYNAKV
jgi:hypothetical protein